MRRFVLIFFIFALPLQFTWAASARYCAHENVASYRIPDSIDRPNWLLAV